MLKFMKNMYIYGIDNPDAEVGLLSRGDFSANIYIVCLEKDGRFLSLMNTAFLKTRYRMEDADLVVAGIASGYNMGLKIIEKMAEDCLSDTGSADIRGYVLRKYGETG